ncbi:hypothetical protein AAGS40_30550 (plasmid) [Paraburkholderia sp. PREW-6R]|uniref:hypothetical protein n=1 Tax=Paraburkholderia sp. PREW-6R TaxID=3141544 RepID=UPI0031F4CF63
MKRILIAALLCMGLFGCASSGRLGALPAITGGQPSSELVLVRPSNFIGAANSYYVALDGKDVFSIRSGDYTKFRVPSGEHTVMVKCFGGWTPTWKEDGKHFVAATDQASFFEISPSFTCAKITQINAGQASKLLAANRFVSTGIVSNRDIIKPAVGSEDRSQEQLPSSSDFPSAPAANLPEYRLTGAAGGRILIASHAEWDRLCRALAVPSVTVVQPPKHGHIEVTETDFIINSSRTRSHCLGHATHGQSVTYIPDSGFTGVDQMSYRVTSPFADAVHTAEVSVR